jgi:hypothetical protein
MMGVTYYVPAMVQIRPQFYDSQRPKEDENVWWAKGIETGGYTADQLTAVQSAVDAAFTSAGWAGHNLSHYQSCYVTDFSNDTGYEVSPNTSIDIAGEGGTPQSSQVAVLVSGEIGLRYRGGRPRIYFPCSAVGESDAYDTVSSGNLTLYNNLVGLIATNLNAISGDDGGPFQWGVFRYRRSEALHAFAAVAWGETETFFATQRRRIRKVPRRK